MSFREISIISFDNMYSEVAPFTSLLLEYLLLG